MGIEHPKSNGQTEQELRMASAPREQRKLKEKEATHRQTEEIDELKEIMTNTDFTTYERNGENIHFHTGTRFKDRFDQWETLKKTLKNKTMVAPDIMVTVKNGKITDVDCPLKKHSEEIRDIANAFTGEEISNATLVKIGDDLYGAHIMHLWDDLNPYEEKPELKAWRILPLGNRKEDKEWITATQKHATELEEDLQIAPEKNPPTEHIRSIPVGITHLPDGTIIDMEKTEAAHVKCTITRPDETTEVWLYTGSLNGEISKLTLLEDSKKRKAITAVASQAILIMRDTTFWENLLGKEVPESEISFNHQLLADETLRALDERENEMKDPANVNAFDLPKDEPIGYIALADTNDKVMKGTKQTMQMMPRLLAKQGYQMYCSPGSDWIDPTDWHDKGTDKVLKDTIREYQKKGIRTVYVTLPAHGSEEGLHYGGTIDPATKQEKPKKILTPSEIVQVLNEFPDMQIIVDTCACYGGNFSEVTKDIEHTEHGRQKVLFLQAKKETVNLINGATHQTIYSTMLIDGLSKGLRYGEAHRHADEVAKRLSGVNAEMHRTRQWGTKKTAQSTPAGNGDIANS